MEDVLFGDLENFPKEGGAERVDGFIGSEAESDGEANAAAFEFALVVKTHAGQSAHQDAVGDEAVVGKNFGAARLVVIFEEAREIILVLVQRVEVIADLRRIGVADRIVKRFVIGEIEAESEEAGFGAPVGFGQKAQIRYSGYCFGPKFLRGRRRIAEEMAPTILENIVEQEHGHVAADAVTVAGDGAEFGELRGARSRIPMIELGDIFPRRVIRIFGEGDEARALRSLHRIIKRGIALEIGLLR